MSDLVTPGEVDAAVDNTSAGHAIAEAGTGAWIVDGVDIAGIYSSLDETVLNAFAYNATASSGLDAVIDPGEAYVGGWLCRDTQTTVTLPASDTVDVYVGYDASAILPSSTAPADNENIIVGLDGDFAAEDPRTHIWTFATDGSSIIDNLDERQLQKPIEFGPNSGLSANADLSLGGSLSVTGTATFNDTATFNAAASFAGLATFNAGMDLSTNNINNVSRLTSHSNNSIVEMDAGTSDENLSLHTGETGSSAVQVWDRTNNVFILRAFEGGNVEIPSGKLDVEDVSSQIRIHESDTGAQWNVAVSGGDLNLVDADGTGLLRLMDSGNMENPDGVISDDRGTAVVSGSQRYIWVSGTSPSDTDGQDGDIWIEH